ncbi:MAG: respiratory nitrate reductase subunit gamma [Corynebacterium pyruviciproducens]|uniref:respiratory nitrate reductase subunit gamma n=1 Tax=Corynebacterium pyruviciproducens TaxID=598660 RepID=UPI003983C412
MTNLSLFFWTVLPWISAVVFVVGLIWRWRYDQYGWTTKSSQVYESRMLRWSSPLFHYGMLGVIVGHIAGLCVPKAWTEAAGIPEHLYHLMAVVLGSIFGAAAIVGLFGLLYRRFVVKSVRFSTTPNDIVMYVLLSAAMLLGGWATLSTQILQGSHGYDYRETISPWIRGVFSFNPQPELMANVPLEFKLHILAGLILLLVWPFTKLVHVVSAPVGYMTRPYIVYRSREATTSDHARRGWSPVNTGYQAHKEDKEAMSRGA